VKRVELIQKLTANGCVFIRHGGKHDWYQNRARECASQCLGIARLRNSSLEASSEIE